MHVQLGDKVGIFDFEKCNFVTPIIKPDAMDRAELLDRVMNNYRRFYMKETFLECPWIRDKQKRRYMLGCLKAFLKSGFERKFYDLGKVNYWGPQSRKKVDFHFDRSRTLVDGAARDWRTAADASRKRGAPAPVMACGGGKQQMAADSEAPAAE